MTNMIRCISPIDGEIYAERPALSYAEGEAAAHRAKAAQKAWAARPLEDRIQLVMKGVELLGAANNEIVPEIAHMMGRPVRYGGEFGGVNERASYCATIAEEALAPQIIENSDAFERRLQRTPLGLVFIVAPWNYPYLTAINTIAPALMAGNTIMLKHASQTILAGERLAAAFHAAGVPEDVFVNVVLGHDTTSALIAANKFDFVNFTGSVGGGRAMEKAAAGTFTPLGLELGGKDPGYVMEDADPVAAAEGLMDGAFFNSGQCCCGIERVYVAEKHFDAFVEKSVEIANSYVLGNPLDEETTMGPMANIRFANEVRSQIDDAIADGATSLVPTMAADGGTYVSPQVLINVSHNMRVMREESFAPVVGIMKVKDDAEALQLMNDCDFGLTCALFTNDAERAGAFGNKLETGTVFMNRCDYLDPALCWTGTKETGRGGSLGHEGFRNLTRPMSFHFRKG